MRFIRCVFSCFPPCRPLSSYFLSCYSVAAFFFPVQLFCFLLCLCWTSRRPAQMRKAWIESEFGGDFASLICILWIIKSVMPPTRIIWFEDIKEFPNWREWSQNWQNAKYVKSHQKIGRESKSPYQIHIEQQHPGPPLKLAALISAW